MESRNRMASSKTDCVVQGVTLGRVLSRKVELLVTGTKKILNCSEKHQVVRKSSSSKEKAILLGTELHHSHIGNFQYPCMTGLSLDKPKRLYTIKTDADVN